MFFWQDHFPPRFTLTLRILPSGKVTEDAVGPAAGTTCVAEPDATAMLLDLT